MSVGLRLRGIIMELVSVTDFEVGGEHLAGDLSVAGLVGADQTQLIAAEDGDQAVEQGEEADGEHDDELACGVWGWELDVPAEPGCKLRVQSARRSRRIVGYRSFRCAERDKANRVPFGVGRGFGRWRRQGGRRGCSRWRCD